jgi:hypothetical protein
LKGCNKNKKIKTEENIEEIQDKQQETILTQNLIYD